MITKGPTIWTALEWYSMLLNKESELYEGQFEDIWNNGDSGCLFSVKIDGVMTQTVMVMMMLMIVTVMIAMIVMVRTCKRRVSMWWWRRQSQLPDCPEFNLSLKFNLILKFSKQDLIQIKKGFQMRIWRNSSAARRHWTRRTGAKRTWC